MGRILLHLLLIALPLLIWLLYLRARGRAEARGRTWRDTPIFVLLASGLVMSALALFFLGAFESAPPGSKYVPAHANEKGEIVPGRFE